jgi:hypothetical protein
MALHKSIKLTRLGDLVPDRRNPRFPPELRESFESDDEIYEYLADSFEALPLAESVALHGYFVSEPMIVTKEDDQIVVLEGNRRLTALNGLARAELRENLDHADRWKAAAEQADIDMEFEVPTLEADTREDADPAIGFRHIGSVLAWKPIQRAQFLAYLIDERGESFTGAADSVGEEESVVRLLYRNQSIIECAREMEETDVARLAKDQFGIFTTALNRAALRQHIGANPISAVEERVPQLTEENLPALVELSSWLFGSNGDSRVITESRQMTMLAAVVANEDAIAELRRTRDLESALEIIPDSDSPEPKRVMRALATGVGHIKKAAASIGLIADDPRAEELSEELGELTDEIIEAIGAEED